MLIASSSDAPLGCVSANRTSVRWSANMVPSGSRYPKVIPDTGRLLGTDPAKLPRTSFQQFEDLGGFATLAGCGGLLGRPGPGPTGPSRQTEPPGSQSRSVAYVGELAEIFGKSLRLLFVSPLKRDHLPHTEIPKFPSCVLGEPIHFPEFILCL